MSAVLTPTSTASSVWRPALLALAVVWLTLGGLYFDTVAAMVGIWSRSETFAHAYLVPPIALWLIWRQRETLARMTPKAQPWVLVAITAFAGMWLMSDLVLVNAGAQFAWVALLVLAVPAVLGWQVALAILFPLLFLFFAVPMGEFMLDPMMDWTADFTVAALRFSGIPVYREGLVFVIPSGNWSVVEACSGVRYLIASFMVGTLFAYLNYRSWQRRAAFMLVSILVPIFANWLRAYGIVMLGHLSGNTLAVGVDHLIYGWVFFGVVVMVMFLIGARWAEPDDAPVAPAPALFALAGRWLAGRPAYAGSSVALAAVTMAIVAVLALPHAAMGWLHRGEAAASLPSLKLPERWPGSAWQSADTRPQFKPHFEQPALEVEQLYTSPAATVGVYLAYYRNQVDQSKLVSSVNTLVTSENQQWNRVAAGVHTSAVKTASGDTSLTWRTARILGANASWPSGHRSDLTVWRVYWVNGHWVAGDLKAKLLGASTRLQGQGDDGAALVLWTDSDKPEQAQAALETFVRDNFAALEALLVETRARR